MTSAPYQEEQPEDDEGFDEGTFNSGAQKRVSVIMLLDTSKSMAPDDAPSPRPIDQLNQELRTWAEEVRQDPRLRHRAEIAVITFGHRGISVHSQGPDGPFVPAAKFRPTRLEAGGVTPMLPGILKAIEISQERKSELDHQRIRRYRPLIFMLTDGGPTSDDGIALTVDQLTPIAGEIEALEADKKLAFFAVGVKGADVQKLKLLAPKRYWDLGVGNFSQFLNLMSVSAAHADPLSAAQDAIARQAGQAPA